MQYPQHILPARNYKFININDIPSNAVFLRAIDNKQPIARSAQDIKNYRGIYTSSENFLNEDGLSVSLLGVYTPEDCKYRINREHKCYHEYWALGHDGLMPKEGEYSYVEDKSYIGMLCGRMSQYMRSLNNVDANSSFENTLEESIIQLHLSIEHKPTFCNFWHCLINIIAVSNQKREYEIKEYEKFAKEYNKEHKKQQKPSAKNLIHKITQEDDEYLTLFVLPEDIKLIQLDEHIYMSNR